VPADAIIARDGPVAAPLDYVVPAASAIVPLVVTASFNGAAAASAYVPEVQVIDPSGRVVVRCPLANSIAAGGSADVSWFPRVGSQVGGSSTLPINPALSGNVIVPTSIVIGTRSVQPAPAAFGSGVSHTGFRTIITRAGVLHDLAIYVGTAAGSVEIGILSTDTPTRKILYKTGYVAVPTSHAWQIVGDPALPVQVGEMYDISIALSSSSCLVFWIGGLVNSGSTDAQSGILPANFVPAPLGAPPKLTWTDVVSPRPYGATTTVDEASLTGQVGVPLVIGRIV
jgi:hypothetical protein